MDIKVIEDDTLVDRIEHVIALTWGQRLFSWPWRPWVKTRSWITTVPSKQMLTVGDVVHMHPEAARALRVVAARQRLQTFDRMENDFYRREFVPHVKPVPMPTRFSFTEQPHQSELIDRLSQSEPVPPVRVKPHQQPFPEQPWRAADTGREAIDSMLDATELKIPVRFSERRNEDGFPAQDSGSSSYGGSD